jgi:hypothetical protein
MPMKCNSLKSSKEHIHKQLPPFRQFCNILADDLQQVASCNRALELSTSTAAVTKKMNSSQ